MLEIRLIMRATHMLAAATWVGGNVFYLVVVVPALKSGGPAPALSAKIAELFKRMVNICVGVLLLSGGYLVFDRLTQTTLVAAYMAQSNIRRLAKRSTRFSKAAPQLMLALGIFVFILGALLNGLFEATIAPH